MNEALSDLRVLDLTMFWSGPSAAGLLADTGAEVIKIEACARPDPIRLNARGAFPEGKPGERPWNRSGMIIERNRNKLGITLDLTQPVGKELFKRLVSISDIVMENYRAGVMEGFGLDYPILSRINPALIMLSLSSRGTTGPHRSHISYGSTLEVLSGLCYITGYPDRINQLGSLAYPDPLASLTGAAMILSAVEYRRRTGKGAYLDVSQLEAVSTTIGEAFLEVSLNHTMPQPMANHHPLMAPHGCFRCDGNDEWVCIEVESEEEWRTLCRVIGHPELEQDERFEEPVARWKNQDELTPFIEEWTSQRNPYEVMHQLQAAGVGSGVVMQMDEVVNDPHLAARHWFRVYEQPGEVGPYPYRGTPFVLSKSPFRIRRPAPRLGEDNQLVLSGLLGLKEDDLEKLEREGIIGTVPTEMAIFSLTGAAVSRE